MRDDEMDERARAISRWLKPPPWSVFRWVRWRLFQQPINVAIALDLAFLGEHEPIRKFGVR